MIKKLIGIFLFSGLWHLSSCIKEIQLEKDSHESRLALMADLHPEGITAYATYSVDLDSNKVGSLDGLNIQIWERNNLLAQLRRDSLSGRYFSNGFRPFPGRTYTLNATHPDFPQVEAKDLFPPEIFIKKLDYKLISSKRESTVPQLIQYHYSFSVELNALDANIQYMELIPTFFYKNQVQLVLPLSGIMSSDSDSPLSWNFIKNSFFVSKESIENHLSPKFNFQGQFVIGEQDSLEKIQLEVRSISEPYFKFFQSAEALRSYEPDIFILDPIYLYSNVQNGHGYFGSYNKDTLSTRIR